MLGVREADWCDQRCLYLRVNWRRDTCGCVWQVPQQAGSAILCLPLSVGQHLTCERCKVPRQLGKPRCGRRGYFPVPPRENIVGKGSRETSEERNRKWPRVCPARYESRQASLDCSTQPQSPLSGTTERALKRIANNSSAKRGRQCVLGCVIELVDELEGHLGAGRTEQMLNSADASA